MLSNAPFACPPELMQLAAGGAPIPAAVVDAGGPLAVESTRMAQEAGLIDPYLVGDEAMVRALAERAGWDLHGVRIIDAAGESRIADQATALAREGKVDLLIKGQIHTDTLMRAVLKRDAGLRLRRRISHVFHMTIPGRPGSLCITDAVVNVAPDVDTRMDIVRNAVGLMHALGKDEPHVAVLSATEQVNDGVPSSVEADEVRRRAEAGQVKGARVYGPLAMDNVLSPDAARIKGINSPVAGDADVVLVPNVEAGNALYKLMVYLMSATAAGVVLGTRIPIVLTSRADPPEARLASVAIATVAARRTGAAAKN
ncbi:MAG: bifunctional enoyl-CoA hydratase/phosphate acetyltransferase [Gammaproteobacteria bacterium]